MTSLVIALASALLAAPQPQDMPADYKALLASLGRSGDFADGVLKVNVPRADLTVTIGGRPAPTPLGFGGWVAFTKAEHGDVMMGDLVLREDEVSPVMSALLDNGIEVTALHNHFFWEQPRIFYMHVHGIGAPADLARRLKPALTLMPVSAPPAAVATEGVDGPSVSAIIGHPGQQSGPVYKVTVGRPDIDMRQHGARINARMGLNTWAAFAGSDDDAMVAGDVAMLEGELNGVLKALRAHGLHVVAIHHHMTGVQPMVVFLHYYGTGPAAALARGVRAAMDQTGHTRRQQK